MNIAENGNGHMPFPIDDNGEGVDLMEAPRSNGAPIPTTPVEEGSRVTRKEIMTLLDGGTLPASYAALLAAVQETQDPILDSCLGTVDMILPALGKPLAEAIEAVKKIIFAGGGDAFVSAEEIEHFVRTVQEEEGFVHIPGARGTGEAERTERNVKDEVVQFVMHTVEKILRITIGELDSDKAQPRIAV